MPRVLILEDDYLVASTIQQALRRLEVRVSLARDGAEVLRAVAGTPPAAAIVDLGLRDGITGPEMAKLLVQRGIPVIVCSAQKGARKLLRGVPVTAFLDKPVKRRALLAAVRSALEQSGAPQPSYIGRFQAPGG